MSSDEAGHDQVPTVPRQATAPTAARPAPLTVAELARLVADTWAPSDDGDEHRIAEGLHRLTGGLPTLTRLALEDGLDAWDRGRNPLDVLGRPEGRVTDWVRTRLLPSLPERAGVLLALASDLWPFSRELAEVLAGATGPAAYDLLQEQGLLTTDAAGDTRVVPLVAACLAQQQTPPGASTAWSAASAWLLRQDHPGPALRAARHAREPGACRALIEEHGARIIASGWATDLSAAAEALPREQTSVRVLIMAGHAARTTGDSVSTERRLRAALAVASEGGMQPPADLLWRLAAVYYGRADFTAALDWASGAALSVPADESSADRAMRLSILTTAHWMLGDQPAATEAARAAVAAAQPGPDDALAAAHLAHALLLSGARRHNALAAARAAAERSGDLALRQRSLVNLADAHLVAAEYAAARDTAAQALSLFERTGPAGCYASGLHNLAEALLGLGDLDGARREFRRGLATARDRGLERTPGPLWGLAEIEYQCGHLDDARVAFEEAVDLARDTGEHQVLVPALARLATILATAPRDEHDLATAARCALEAVAEAGPESLPEARVALGWVRLAAGDADQATDLAEQAVAEARAVANRRALGPALELGAAAESDQSAAAALLEEALAVHQRSGAALAADRIQVALSRLPCAPSVRGAAARAAARRLRLAGVLDRPLHPQGAGISGTIEIRVLGGFAVTRDGVPVPTSAWRSRQARTLLKLLVARHGRPLGREELCETLWPGDDPARTGHRLSVLLSTLRGVLDPDRRHSPEHFLAADTHGLRLDQGHVTVDLAEFLDDVAEATQLAEEGDDAAARGLLADLLAGYRGEAFEDDPYEPWAQEVRDHVRAAWVQSLRLAARLAGRAGEIDLAATCLVRLLAADPYDDPAHRLLVAVLVRAGRHGEARHAFDRWLRAMTDIGAPVPDPGLLVT